jgi:indole-3-glycerol phosphate synthase
MTVLEQIVAQRTRDVRAERREVPAQTLQAMLAERGERRSLAAALLSEPPAIVAEIKRASPSAGRIDLVSSAARIAVAYERGGGVAVSVVVEPRWFAGRFADLGAVRASIRLPILCKDFVVDDFQLLKAAAFGADAILLIAAILDNKRLHHFVAQAQALGLDPVVEVHTVKDLERAIAAGAQIIGVNNRDLATLAVDVQVALHLKELVPPGRIVLAESGYSSPQELAGAMQVGIGAFLIGEPLMRSGDPAATLKALCKVHAWSR